MERIRIGNTIIQPKTDKADRELDRYQLEQLVESIREPDLPEPSSEIDRQVFDHIGINPEVT